jgi:flagellar basal-body rod protein FlgF
MNGSIYLAASGALACERRLAILANNLANVNTVGYKKDICHFQRFLSASEQGSAEDLPGELQAPAVWINMDSSIDMSSGPLQPTGNKLDVALAGKGFFCVQTPEGTQYTRNGNFTVNADGQLVTQEGLPVLGQSGSITIDDPDVSIGEDGTISVDDNVIAQLRIVDFFQPGSLQKVADTRFAPVGPDAAEQQPDDVQVREGFLEQSNVDVVRMMTEMIEVHRGFEFYQKVIRSVDDINSKTVNELPLIA